MDPLQLVKAIILGIVEGFTEFLPISSTGHLIVIEDLLSFRLATRDVFVIAIQAGAILAVCWEYRARLVALATGLASRPREQRLALNVVIAFLPAGFAGVMFKNAIELKLFNPLTVAVALVLGGIIILLVERRHRRLYGARDLQGGRLARVETIDDIRPLDALKVGLAQCAALIPGTSRSGATIIGGILFGFSRKAATEFSFFLAIPTVIGATVYSLYRARDHLSMAELPYYAGGFIASFVAALVCVRWLLRYLATNDFVIFGWYRIAFGGLILLTAYTGLVNWGD
ncbi:MAG: undecaprenyl-diphosphate phosphatase [Burkholderiales bacterium]|nr:undecaprenyl-diphosphate phosphatase [Burkholderiales bacterium]